MQPSILPCLSGADPDVVPIPIVAGRCIEVLHIAQSVGGTAKPQTIARPRPACAWTPGTRRKRPIEPDLDGVGVVRTCGGPLAQPPRKRGGWFVLYGLLEGCQRGLRLPDASEELTPCHAKGARSRSRRTFGHQAQNRLLASGYARVDIAYALNDLWMPRGALERRHIGCAGTVGVPRHEHVVGAVQ
jgi:hypothetical protein